MDAVNDEDWDYITVQQGSVESGQADTYDDLTPILNAIMAAKPEATVMWNMTWAYQQTLEADDRFAPYNRDQTTMYNAIVDSVKKKIVPDLEINAVIPNGTAIQNARTSLLGDTLTRDGLHLGLIGQYVAAMSYAYLMTGYDINNITYVPSGIDETTKAICIESVFNAIERPFYVTQSAYPGEEAPKTYYEMSDYDWSVGYWQSTRADMFDVRLETTVTSTKYISTRRFTREDLPVGTVIVVADRYQYRPEAWKGTGVQTTRPGNVTTTRIVIDEAWWADYDYRAFNIFAIDESYIDVEEAKAAFKIWLPR